MAKRKRLTPAQPDYLDTETPVLETKSMGFPPARAPIAQVAGEASAAAALQELAGEMNRARDEGRLIQSLPLDAVEVGYLVRDRILADDAELQVLIESLKARGQQTPIEVVRLEDGRYGLISGWRRLTALRKLLDATGDARFATVQAILRRPETAAEAYVAMVEENEIRVGLSYYERARVAAKAVEQGVYGSEKEALLELFASASRAKRSKIRSFLPLYHALDHGLRFASAIPERLGLALSGALEQEAGFAEDLCIALLQAAPDTPEAEVTCLEAALAKSAGEKSLNGGSETKRQARPAPGAAAKPAPDATSGYVRPVRNIDVAFNGRSVTLTGPGVTEAFREKLLAWLKANA